MTESEAYRVLGLPENTGPEHIRTRYRELIVQVHPDKVRRRSAQSSDWPCMESETDSQEHQSAPFTTPHDARIINQAYNLLQRSWRKTRNSQEARASSDGQDFQKKTAQSTGKWDAPCNPYTYESCFYEVVDYKDMVIMADGVKCRLILSHYFIPFYNGARHMAFMLHGHTHKTEESVMEERIKEDIRRKGLRCEAYNVGAMWQNYEPQTFEEIIARQGRKIPLI